ncbi:n-terminal acetyltransferase [Anaeramoeba flamelloides]|uniref:N-terminal acetyltransferase n=1 Tax=Anaeramoeba flamelloides TaxID=1746091 RepID=A0AAV8AFH5_9EUKA|nr:n-terminal acetyltransferase [Anaeramoeba flamelloides]KAJ6249485.1 n-terminal acetyltransferase [Anaeramoeba flamelloides]
MVIIRNARFEDIVAIQNANLQSLPENYQMRYYLYHFLTWPELTHVAENFEGKIVGYVLGKLDDSNKNADYRYGMITSVAINRHYRKLGLATRLMKRTLAAMKEVYDVKYVTLHVRAGNDAAKHLYKNVLKFEKEYVEEGYYADGEDAISMNKYYDDKIRKQVKEERKKKEKKKKMKKITEKLNQANINESKDKENENENEKDNEKKEGSNKKETNKKKGRGRGRGRGKKKGKGKKKGRGRGKGKGRGRKKKGKGKRK